MSDISATNCGCGCDNDCGGARNTSLFGGNSCCSIIWILLLLSCCGGDGYGFGNGCGNDSCIWIILLLLCCGGCGNF